MTESETLLAWSGPAAKPLPRLRARGQFLEQDDGTYWTAIECSDFNLYGRYLDGEDIRPVLRDRAGFNLLRVWTLFDLETSGIGRLVLEEHPDLYARLPSFLQLCAVHGFYVELTAYTSILDPNHWPRLCAAVAGCTNVLLELVNEYDQSANHGPDAEGRYLDAQAFAPAPGILCSHGSNGSEARPVEPFWDYATFHTNDANEWQRKVGHNAMEIWGGPTIANENTRYCDRDANLQHANDAAAGAALLCAGSCFHSVSGKKSVVFTENESLAARLWVDGAMNLNLAYQDGQYGHRVDLEKLAGLTVLRVYERRFNATSSETVFIHK